MKETDSTVREILEQLVAHFGESIHAEVLLNSYSKDATTIPLLSSTTNGSKKEQLEHQERSTPRIVQLWLDRLLSLGHESPGPKLVQEVRACDGTTDSSDNDTITAVLGEWIYGYEKFVRPHLFQVTSASIAFNTMPTFDDRSVPILKNYELVLSKLLLKSIDMEEESSVAPNSPPLDSQRKLLRVMNLLCTDITLLTAITSDNDERKKDAKNHLRRNEVLPTLLQILGNTVEILRQATSTIFQSKLQIQEIIPECFRSLRLCAVTLLAFDLVDDSDDHATMTTSALTCILPHSLSPSLASPSQNNDLTLVRRILERIQLSITDTPSTAATQHLEIALGDDSLSYNDIDDKYWNSLLSNSQSSFSLAAWIDSNPNNARGILRIVHGIWRSMESLLMVLSKLENKVDILDMDVRVAMKHQERRSLVLEKLGGPDLLLGDVRAHFFGRNLHGMDDLIQQKTKSNGVADMELSSVVIKMGRRVTKTNKTQNPEGSPTESPVFERFPSRIAAALSALRLLIIPERIEGMNDACRENVLQNVFPVCAALIDSNNAEFGALGAAGLLKVIDGLVPRKGSMASKDSISDEQTSIIHSEAWRNFTENTLAVLERSLQTNRDHGHVIVAIGRLQSRIFEIMLSEEIQHSIAEHFRQRRRMVTQQWLLKLERALYRPVSKRQHLELLLGGVIPLLSQHAMDERSEADGMELGRLGLAALLPITAKVTTTGDMTTESGGDKVGTKAQMAAMVALINLVFSAHPTISRHGGKIMSHLLTAAASTVPLNDDDSDSESEGSLEEISPSLNSIRNMAVLVAAVAIVVCDHKSVHDVLGGIDKDHDQYQKNILMVLSEIREVAVELKAIAN